MNQSDTPTPPARPPAMPGGHFYLTAVAVGHWLWGAVVGVLSLLGIPYMMFGADMMNGSMGLTSTTFPQYSSSTMPTTVAVPVVTTVPMTGTPPWLSWVFVGMGAMMLMCGLLIAVANVVSGVSILQRRRRRVSLAVAGINCLGIPFGTVLGIYTFVLLSQEEIKAEYVTDAIRQR